MNLCLNQSIECRTKLKLYNTFLLPHFQYCSTVWHFCSARNCEKKESLNKRALRIVFNDKVSSYQQLLHNSRGATLYNRRIQNMLIAIYKCLNHVNRFSFFSRKILAFQATLKFEYKIIKLMLCYVNFGTAREIWVVGKGCCLCFK